MPYTLTCHSGLGRTAVEARSVTRGKLSCAIEQAGGIVVEGYTHAGFLEGEALRFRAGAIVPHGVDGTFHPSLEVDGLPVLLPGRRLSTLAALLSAGMPASQAREAANGLAGDGGIAAP
jgi:hypothetical protein